MVITYVTRVHMSIYGSDPDCPQVLVYKDQAKKVPKTGHMYVDKLYTT